MLAYLRELTALARGPVKVWMRAVGEDRAIEYTMTGYDELGVVVSNSATGDVGVAYPWSSVVSISPVRQPRP